MVVVHVTDCSRGISGVPVRELFVSVLERRRTGLSSLLQLRFGVYEQQ